MELRLPVSRFADLESDLCGCGYKWKHKCCDDLSKMRKRSSLISIECSLSSVKQTSEYRRNDASEMTRTGFPAAAKIRAAVGLFRRTVLQNR